MSIECKNYCQCKNDYSWDLSVGICENDNYLRSIASTSVTECNEIIIILDLYQQKRQIL